MPAVRGSCYCFVYVNGQVCSNCSEAAKADEKRTGYVLSMARIELRNANRKYEAAYIAKDLDEMASIEIRIAKYIAKILAISSR